jgi:septin 3/9/12
MAAAAGPIAPEEIRAESYVGFDTITQQIEHKLLKRGFQFNVILVGTSTSDHLRVLGVLICSFFRRLLGQTGLGKSTLINTIFASHLVDSKGRFAADEPVRQTTEIQAVSHGTLSVSVRFTVTHVNVRIVIVENGVKLRLNIVDTPGYGDQINNEGWCVF